MSLLRMVSSSSLLTHGCKHYYNYLFNLSKISKMNNWKIISGKYENQTFIIPTDTYVSKKLKMSVSSISNYKKILKALGLIAILPKCTTRTNKQRNYHNRQLTVVMQTLSRKFIAKSLIYLKNANFLKTSGSIITRFKTKINTFARNIHTNIKKMLNFVGNSMNLNKKDVQDVTDILNQNNIEFKSYELKFYIKLHKISKTKFIQTCKKCRGKKINSPLKYITTVFNSIDSNTNYFHNFPQRSYNYSELEKLLIANNDIPDLKGGLTNDTSRTSEDFKIRTSLKNKTRKH